jgi:hypothetical protein
VFLLWSPPKEGIGNEEKNHRDHSNWDNNGDNFQRRHFFFFLKEKDDFINKSKQRNILCGEYIPDQRGKIPHPYII